MADDIKIVADYSDLQLMRRELVGMGKDAKTSASVFEREFSRVERQLIRQEKEFRNNATSSQLFYNKLLGLDKVTKSASLSASVFEKELKRVDVAAKRATSSVNTLGNSNGFAGKKINRMGANLQQVGYQVGDFAVQIQGGTNAAVAFGQQGAQLLGIFGAGGALAGAALAITTALIAPLMRGEKEVSKLVDRIKELKGEIQDLKGFSLPPEYVAALSKVEDIQLKIYAAEDALVKVKERNADILDRNVASSLAYQNAQSEIVDAENVVNGLLENRADVQELLSSYADAFNDKIKLLHDQEAKALSDEIALLSMKIQFGQDSVAVRDLEKQQIIKAYEEDLKRLGLNPQLIQGLLDQKSAALGLADELERAEQADLRRSKIKFPNLGMSDAMMALNYQQYGETRVAAPATPPTPKKINISTGGGKSPQEQLAEFLAKKKEEAYLQSQLVGLFGEERDLQSELIKFKQDYGKVASEAQTAEYTATVQQIAADKERQKVLDEARQQQEQLADFIANSMGDALMSVVDGTMSVKDAFKSMAADIIKELYRVLVVQQLVNSAKGFLGFADGGAFSGGSQVQAYANGGVVGGPTTFPMAGGKTGLMGEAGPEAIMPLKRGANGKLGVQMEGGGGDTIVVNQSFNFQANGDDTIKQLIAQAAPKIAQMTKSSLLDDRRRGGSTKAAFG